MAINSTSKLTSCVRHPEKKVKFFCQTDASFLCSKCVIHHTGGGHIIKEQEEINIEKAKRDF